MNAAAAILNLIYQLALWAAFIVGIAVQDVWLAGPAAFLILLEHEAGR